MALLSCELGWRSWSNEVEDRIGNVRNSPTVTMLRANWFVFFEFLFVRACQCSCLCARVKDTRKRGRVRIAPCLSGFVVCSLVVFLDVMSVLC